MISKTFFLVLFIRLLFVSEVNAQKPKDGTYTYTVAFAEWDGKSMGASVIVTIKGDSVIVIHNGSNLSGKKGEVIDRGVLMKNKKSGKWIIGNNKNDIYEEEIGGCTGGPAIINFRKKVYWLC